MKYLESSMLGYMMNEKRRDSTAPLKHIRIKFFNYVGDEEELEFTQFTSRNFNSTTTSTPATTSTTNSWPWSDRQP